MPAPPVMTFAQTLINIQSSMKKIAYSRLKMSKRFYSATRFFASTFFFSWLILLLHASALAGPCMARGILNAPTILLEFGDVDEKCAFRTASFDITRAPTKGRIVAKISSTIVSRRHRNPACRGKAIKDMRLVYIPNKNSMGQDWVELRFGQDSSSTKKSTTVRCRVEIAHPGRQSPAIDHFRLR